MFLRHIFHVLISATAFIFVITTCGYFASFLSRQDDPEILKTIKTQQQQNMEKRKTDDTRWHDIVWPLLWNLSYIYLFIGQHSIMASTRAKNFIDQIGLNVVQRSIYVLSSCLILNLLMSKWNVIVFEPLWLINTADNDVYWWIFSIIHGLAWIITFGGCILMDFNELVGIKQVYYSIRHLAEPMLYKSTELQRLYTHMRHPSFTCFLIVFWIHPHMTLDRILLGFMLTVYMMSFFKVDRTDYRYQKEQFVRKREYSVAMYS